MHMSSTIENLKQEIQKINAGQQDADDRSKYDDTIKQRLRDNIHDENTIIGLSHQYGDIVYKDASLILLQRAQAQGIDVENINLKDFEDADGFNFQDLHELLMEQIAPKLREEREEAEAEEDEEEAADTAEEGAADISQETPEGAAVQQRADMISLEEPAETAEDDFQQAAEEDIRGLVAEAKELLAKLNQSILKIRLDNLDQADFNRLYDGIPLVRSIYETHRKLENMIKIMENPPITSRQLSGALEKLKSCREDIQQLDPADRILDAKIPGIVTALDEARSKERHGLGTALGVLLGIRGLIAAAISPITETVQFYWGSKYTPGEKATVTFIGLMFAGILAIAAVGLAGAVSAFLPGLGPIVVAAVIGAAIAGGGLYTKGRENFNDGFQKGQQIVHNRFNRDAEKRQIVNSARKAVDKEVEAAKTATATAIVPPATRADNGPKFAAQISALQSPSRSPSEMPVANHGMQREDAVRSVGSSATLPAMGQYNTQLHRARTEVRAEAVDRGPAMTQAAQQFIAAASKAKTLPIPPLHEKLPSVQCTTLVTAQTSSSTQMQFDFHHEGSAQPDRLTFEYSQTNGVMSATLTRNSSDASFISFCMLYKQFSPLELDPCGEGPTVLKLLQAAKMTGVKIILDPSDEKKAAEANSTLYAHIKDETLSAEYFTSLFIQSKGTKLGKNIPEFDKATLQRPVAGGPT